MKIIDNRLVLLRHGETAGQSSIRFYGATDISLSDIGREQMRRARQALSSLTFKEIVVSSMDRSQESARLALDGAYKEPTVVEGFREIDFGIFEGLTEEEIAERHPELHHTWRVENALDAFPDGDNREGFVGRIKNTAREVFTSIELPSIAVLHKGVIRGILSELLNIPNADLMEQPIELGCIHILERGPNGWKLIVKNDTAHLGDLRMDHS